MFEAMESQGIVLPAIGLMVLLMVFLIIRVYMHERHIRRNQERIQANCDRLDDIHSEHSEDNKK